MRVYVMWYHELIIPLGRWLIKLLWFQLRYVKKQYFSINYLNVKAIKLYLYIFGLFSFKLYIFSTGTQLIMRFQIFNLSVTYIGPLVHPLYLLQNIGFICDKILNNAAVFIVFTYIRLRVILWIHIVLQNFLCVYLRLGLFFALFRDSLFRSVMF